MFEKALSTSLNTLLDSDDLRTTILYGNINDYDVETMVTSARAKGLDVSPDQVVDALDVMLRGDSRSIYAGIMRRLSRI